MTVSPEEQFHSIEEFMAKVVKGQEAIAQMPPAVIFAEEQLRTSANEERLRQVADAAGISVEMLQTVLQVGTAGPQLEILNRMIDAGVGLTVGQPGNLDRLAMDAMRARDLMVARLKVLNALWSELAGGQTQGRKDPPTEQE